jgi:hypothetical protein
MPMPRLSIGRIDSTAGIFLSSCARARVGVQVRNVWGSVLARLRQRLHRVVEDGLDHLLLLVGVEVKLRQVQRERLALFLREREDNHLRESRA